MRLCVFRIAHRILHRHKADPRDLHRLCLRGQGDVMHPRIEGQRQRTVIGVAVILQKVAIRGIDRLLIRDQLVAEPIGSIHGVGIRPQNGQRSNAAHIPAGIVEKQIGVQCVKRLIHHTDLICTRRGDLHIEGKRFLRRKINAAVKCHSLAVHRHGIVRRGQRAVKRRRADPRGKRERGI